jgi:hypothetical protein
VQSSALRERAGTGARRDGEAGRGGSMGDRVLVRGGYAINTAAAQNLARAWSLAAGA